jgi:hypothetical protein
MPDYELTAPDGRIVRVSGDKPPSQEDAQKIFQSIPANQQAAQPKQSPSWAQSAGEAAIRTSGQMIGPFTRPILGLVGQAEEMMGAKSPRTLPLPRFMGGDVTVDRPTSMKGAAQTVGSLVEGAANYLLPGTVAGRDLMMSAGAAKSGAALMGLNRAGQAIGQQESPTMGALHTGEAATIGGALGKAGDVVGNPEQLQGLKDYVMPSYKAAGLREEITRGEADVKQNFRDLREKAADLQLDKNKPVSDLRAATQKAGVQQADIGAQKQQVAQARSQISQAAQQKQAALQTEWGTKIADADAKLSEAMTKNIPHLKSQVLQVRKNMTTAYGDVIDKAMEGKELFAPEWREQVPGGILQQMDEANVPKDSRIYQTIKGLSENPKAVPEPKEAAGFAETEAAPKEEAKPDLITAQDFKYQNKRVMDTVRQSVKDGSASPNQEEYWAYRFKDAQGEYVGRYVPEVAAINPSYREMSAATRTLIKATKPYTQFDQDGAISLMKKLASGEPISPSTQATLKASFGGPKNLNVQESARLAEEGHGQIPGLGKGALTRPFAQQAQELSSRRAGFEQATQQVKDQTAQGQMALTDRQNALRGMSTKIQQDLAIERQKLTSQIDAINTRMKEVQKSRATAGEAREAIDQLRIKQKRLEKIAAWERGVIGFGATALGLGAAGAAYNKVSQMP